MKSRQIHLTMISAYVSNTHVPDLHFVSNDYGVADIVNSSVTGVAVVEDALFKALISLTLKRCGNTPLNTAMTALLGISTGDEVIYSKQIGITVGADLHGLIVSIKPNTDDVILVNRTRKVMHIYLTDSRRKLRAAATLRRDSDQPSPERNEDSIVGYSKELCMWSVLAEIARL